MNPDMARLVDGITNCVLMSEINANKRYKFRFSTQEVKVSIPDSPTLTLRKAAELMGVGQTTMYAAAREGTLPFPVLKVNSRYIVPTKPFLAALGIESEVPKEVA